MIVEAAPGVFAVFFPPEFEKLSKHDLVKSSRFEMLAHGNFGTALCKNLGCNLCVALTRALPHQLTRSILVADVGDTVPDVNASSLHCEFP
ncbi:MAG: hypothetical protein ABSH31_08605 [Bryobacteraceae bacterium]